MAMNAAELSALAALAGSALGGITPVISNQLTQRELTRRELLGREIAARQTLYEEFIRFATTVYIQAVTSSLEKIDDLILMHALVGRIRLMGSPPVIKAAENFTRVVTKRFGEKNLTLEDLRTVTIGPRVDPLNEFSERCRDEIAALLKQGLK